MKKLINAAEELQQYTEMVGNAVELGARKAEVMEARNWGWNNGRHLS
jgi:hypothetical protein